MRAQKLLLASAVLAACVCAWVAYELLGDAPPPQDVIAGVAAPAQTGSVHSDLASVAKGADVDVDEDAVQELDPTQRARSAEVVLTDADTLRAVRGRVIDARTREPVAGLSLSFLSRRPRNVTVRTDADGRFETAAELACGAVNVLHVPDHEGQEVQNEIDTVADPRFAARWEIEPNQFVLTPACAKTAGAPHSGDEPRELLLLAHDPERVLVVDVRLPDGAPAEGAAVSLTFGNRAEDGGFVPLGRDFEESDARGFARFALYGDAIDGRVLRLEAEHKGTLSSDVMALDPPFAWTPVALPLHPGGVLRVRATNDEGHPVAGVSLYISLHEDARASRGWHGETDASGEGVFTALRAGCYTVSAVHPLTGERYERPVDLVRGAQVVNEFKLSLLGLRLAAQGAVLDEFGYPLPGVELRLTHASGETVTLISGDKGQFEFWSKPEASLLLAVGGGFLDDRFDPEETLVPFGARDIVLRRSESFESRVLAFEVVDKEDGSALRAAHVVLYHGEPQDAGARNLARFDAPTGVVQTSFKLRPDLRYVVEAPEHVRLEGRLSDLYRRDPARVYAKIALERGFERRLVARDRVTKRALGRVHVVQGENEIATSDSEGRIELSLETWPASLRCDCTGYRTLSWDPKDASFPSDVLWFEPLQ